MSILYRQIFWAFPFTVSCTIVSSWNHQFSHYSSPTESCSQMKRSITCFFLTIYLSDDGSKGWNWIFHARMNSPVKRSVTWIVSGVWGESFEFELVLSWCWITMRKGEPPCAARCRQLSPLLFILLQSAPCFNNMLTALGQFLKAA